jgi:hypothetical protein
MKKERASKLQFNNKSGHCDLILVVEKETDEQKFGVQVK